MAIIRILRGKSSNVILQGASGIIGPLVIKQTKRGIQITNRRPPRPRRRKKKAAEVEKESLFKDAVRYAKAVNKNPKRKEAYLKKLNGKRNAYQAALSDYLTNTQLNRRRKSS